jgi:hypothetical protein
MLCYVMLCYVMLCYVVLCYVVILYYIILYYIILYFIILYYIILYYIILYYTLLGKLFVFHSYNHVSLILSRFKLYYLGHKRRSVDTDEDGYRGFPLPVSCCVFAWSFLSVSTNSKFASRVTRCLVRGANTQN